MKKIMFFLMAMMAIVMTSCKHDTCTLRAENHYDKSAVILFSQDEKCTDIDEAVYAVHLKPQTYWEKSGVNVKGMHAILYICVDEEKTEEGLSEAYQRKMSVSLDEYAGSIEVTVKVSAEGYLDKSAWKL